MSKRHLWPAGVALILSLTNSAQARLDIQVNYTDPEGYGFKDTTPATPVGGNSGTTLGLQRTIALEYALTLLSYSFNSSIPVVVDARFSNEGGSATKAVLASAGPITLHRDFTGAEAGNNVLYPAALANKLSGSDIAGPEFSDLQVVFNEDIDGPIVFLDNGWYYGLYTAPIHANDTDFVSVAIHELLHGFGFISYVNVLTGAYECGSSSGCVGLTDIYTHNVETYDPTAQLASLSDAQRADALGNSVTPGSIRWSGAITQKLVQYLNLANGISGENKPKLHAPASPVQGSTLSHLSTEFNPSRLMEASYVAPNQDFSLAAAMLADMGWGPRVVDFSNSFSGVTLLAENGLFYLNLILENLGPDETSRTQVDITINAESASFFSPERPANSNDGICTTTASLVSCTINSLNPSGRNTIELWVNYQSYGELEVTLTTPDVEINPANSAPRIGLNESGGVQVSNRIYPTRFKPPVSPPAQSSGSSGGALDSNFSLVLLMVLLIQRLMHVRLRWLTPRQSQQGSA